MGCQIEKVQTILNNLERNNIDVSELKAQVNKKIAEKKAASKNGYTVTPKAKPDMVKAKYKASKANKYIGYGKPGSSTALYGTQLTAQGMPVNTGEYSKGDTVFTSVNGTPSRTDYLNTLKQVVAALEAGATILTDSESYLTKSTYNKGEQELAKYLLSKGYVRVTSKDNSEVAEWGKVNKLSTGNSKVKVVESLLSESEQNTLKSTIENMLKDKNIDRVHNRTGQTGIAFGPVGYSYGKTRPVVHKQKDMPKELLELAKQISASLGRGNGYYNHVLINKFDDDVGIGMHRDNEEIYQNEIGEVGSVAIYSIGSTKVPHIIENEKYTAKNNSLVEMASGSMYHSVGAADGVRYSFTFRHIPENNLPKKTTSVDDNDVESKMRQLLTIYKDKDAPKIGGGLVEDVTRKSMYDEDAKVATMMKGTQDSTLKDMLPKVDGRTINAYEKAVNAWYGEMKRGSAIQNKLSEFAKLIETIEYSPELMEELGWSKEADKQEADIILPTEVFTNNLNKIIDCKSKI